MASVVGTEIYKSFAPAPNNRAQHQQHQFRTANYIQCVYVCVTMNNDLSSDALKITKKFLSRSCHWEKLIQNSTEEATDFPEDGQVKFAFFLYRPEFITISMGTFCVWSEWAC